MSRLQPRGKCEYGVYEYMKQHVRTAAVPGRSKPFGQKYQECYIWMLMKIWSL